MISLALLQRHARLLLAFRFEAARHAITLS
jgi:hypothetical protein